MVITFLFLPVYFSGKRFLVDVLNTVDYLDLTDGTVIFRTCDKEKDKVVVQLGTCSPERALKVGKMMYIL